MKSRLVILLSFFFVSGVHAMGCYQQSPNLVGMEDSYFDVDQVIELTREQEKEIDFFVRTIDGDWVGSASEVECKGPDRQPREEVNTASAKVRILQLSTGEIVLKISNEYFDEKLSKRKRREKLEFTLLGNRAMGYQISEGILSTVNKFRKTKIITPGYYVIEGGVKKYIPPVTRSQLIERVVDIEALDENLNISINHYSNGVYVFRQQLQLSKR